MVLALLRNSMHVTHWPALAEGRVQNASKSNIFLLQLVVFIEYLCCCVQAVIYGRFLQGTDVKNENILFLKADIYNASPT